LFHGETGLFGLFTEVGAPTRSSFALQAFERLIETPRRVPCAANCPTATSSPRTVTAC
jgi:hypothetical protein